VHQGPTEQNQAPNDSKHRTSWRNRLWVLTENLGSHIAIRDEQQLGDVLEDRRAISPAPMHLNP
jgi:hypothetical protein